MTGRGPSPRWTRPKDAGFCSWHEGSHFLRVQYHLSKHDFVDFSPDKSDLGAHFGSLEHALGAMKHCQPIPGKDEALVLLPVWLAIRRPLRLRDEGTFHADGIAVQLERMGLLKKGEGRAIRREVDANFRLRKQYDPYVKSVIESAGFDGVVYRNNFEAQGQSVIAFHAHQVRFALSPLMPLLQRQLLFAAGRPRVEHAALQPLAHAILARLDEAGLIDLQACSDWRELPGGLMAQAMLDAGLACGVEQANGLIGVFGPSMDVVWSQVQALAGDVAPPERRCRGG